MAKSAASTRSRKPGRARRFVGVIADGSASKGRRLAHLLGVFAAVGLVGLLAVVVFALALIPFTPGGRQLERIADARVTTVLAASGETITEFQAYGRDWVPLDSIPQHVQDALLATEDRAFYRHGGVNLVRTFLIPVNWARGQRGGASTLTQQLARNIFPEQIGNSRTLFRKMKEIVTAYKIETRNSKDEILEAYLNSVPFLYNAVGIEMAARTYFSKPAYELTVPEGAVLVAMLRATSSYNPVRNPDRALSRRNLVLALMADQGHITEAQAAEYQATDLGVRFDPQEARRDLAPHFSRRVREFVNAWAERRGYDAEEGGLVVHTTLDMGLQRAAERAVRTQGDRLQTAAGREWAYGGTPFRAFYRENLDVFERHARRTAAFEQLRQGGASEADALSQLSRDGAFVDSLRQIHMRIEAGFVAVNPRTGWVRAYVGSRDFARGQFDHVTEARRQPGSTFKPFVYAAAMRRGFSPLDRLPDVPVSIDLGGGRVWRPTNSGSTSGQEITLADGLAYSKNTITAQLIQQVGPQRVAALARRMGVDQSPLEAVPALALGTSPVTLLEMVSSYATLANDGLYREPILVQRIETPDGRVLEEFGSRGHEAIAPRTARTVVDMMRGVIDRGTGRRLHEYIDASYDLAGKTGTTQRAADGWFIAMHPDVVAGAWVGWNDQAITWRSRSAYGQGGRNALPMVGLFLQSARGRLRQSARFPEPPDYFDPYADPYADAGADSSFFARARDWFSGAFGGDDEDYDPQEQRQEAEDARARAEQRALERERRRQEQDDVDGRFDQQQREYERDRRDGRRDREQDAREAEREALERQRAREEERRERLREQIERARERRAEREGNNPPDASEPPPDDPKRDGDDGDDGDGGRDRRGGW